MKGLMGIVRVIKLVAKYGAVVMAVLKALDVLRDELEKQGIGDDEK